MSDAFDPRGESVGPQPCVMALDRAEWFRQLHLSNFINTYYQYRDISCSVGDALSVLVVGPGQGLDTALFRWRGLKVVTFDIDETFGPDVVGSCHAMPMFSDQQFDVVVASHVLEHLPVNFLNLALEELSRVAANALIYLPVAGRHAVLRLAPGFRGMDFSLACDLFRFWHRPSGTKPVYSNGQHYWEVGYRGYRVSDLKRRFSPFFDVVQAYRNKDWLPSYNFVLKSKYRVKHGMEK